MKLSLFINNIYEHYSGVYFRSLFLLALSFSFLSVVGCTTTDRSLSDIPDANNEQHIATDLISALMQLPEYIPFYTTLQLSNPQGRFGKSLLETLEVSGYGVQLVSADQGNKYLTYSRSHTIADENIKKLTFSIAVNNLKISRDFKKQGEYLFPDSVMRIQGVEPSKVILNDDIYRRLSGSTVIPQGVEFLDNSGNPINTIKKDLVVKKRHELVSGEMILHHRFLTLARARIFTNDRVSRPASIRNEIAYPKLETTIVFNPDSLRLGQLNKNNLYGLKESYTPDTDFFDIIACNYGKQLIGDGTDNIALERSMRTKEELLLIGVKLSDIRENGCFFNDRLLDEKLPDRGVLITLKKRA